MCIGKDNKTNIMNFRIGWFPEAECPGCGKRITFTENGPISVNCHSRGRVYVDGMFVLDRKCTNPLCKHSNISDEDK